MSLVLDGLTVMKKSTRTLGANFDGSEYTAEEVQFLKAMADFMKANNVRYPTFTDVLRVAKSLGYRRVEDESPSPQREK